nr:hypothetical protein Iba_chr12bCG15670 [Ipomoea batatas]
MEILVAAQAAQVRAAGVPSSLALIVLSWLLQTRWPMDSPFNLFPASTNASGTACNMRCWRMQSILLQKKSDDNTSFSVYDRIRLTNGQEKKKMSVGQPKQEIEAERERM